MSETVSAKRRMTQNHKFLSKCCNTWTVKQFDL